MSTDDWRREDDLDRELNRGILDRAIAEPDFFRAWLGFMGFAKEEEARLSRKLHHMQMEAANCADSRGN